MNENISLYQLLETAVTDSKKRCDSCGKTQSDFDASLLDSAIPSNLDLPVIREIILQRRAKVEATPHTEVLELLSSFPENTIHVVTLPDVDPNAKVYIGKGNECESATLICLLINGVYVGSYTSIKDDAELYFNDRLCNFETLIKMLDAYEENAYGELNLSPLNNLPIKPLSGYIPLVARKFMTPNNTYDNYANIDFQRFVKWVQPHLNHKLVYNEYPDSHMIIAKSKDKNTDYYIAVKNGDQNYRTMEITLEADTPKFIDLIVRLITDEDADTNIFNRLRFDSSSSLSSHVSARHLEMLLNNLD